MGLNFTRDKRLDVTTCFVVEVPMFRKQCVVRIMVCASISVYHCVGVDAYSTLTIG